MHYGMRNPNKTLPQSRQLKTAMSQIRIDNPSPGTAERVSKSQADRYVRQGKAVLTDDKLRFIGSRRLPSDVYIPGGSKWNMYIANSRQKNPARNDIFPHYVWERGLGQ